MSEANSIVAGFDSVIELKKKIIDDAIKAKYCSGTFPKVFSYTDNPQRNIYFDLPQIEFSPKVPSDKMLVNIGFILEVYDSKIDTIKGEFICSVAMALKTGENDVPAYVYLDFSQAKISHKIDATKVPGFENILSMLDKIVLPITPDISLLAKRCLLGTDAATCLSVEKAAVKAIPGSKGGSTGEGILAIAFNFTETKAKGEKLDALGSFVDAGDIGVGVHERVIQYIFANEFAKSKKTFEVAEGAGTFTLTTLGVSPESGHLRIEGGGVIDIGETCNITFSGDIQLTIENGALQHKLSNVDASEDCWLATVDLVQEEVESNMSKKLETLDLETLISPSGLDFELVIQMLTRICSSALKA